MKPGLASEVGLGL